ncbi:hypothetical protein AN1V17_08130 [Vallitalea sediminicola]
MGLREKKKQRTRKAILDYSKQRFIEDGYKKVTTAEIASALEIGEGTIFNYFNSKGQLFIECLVETVKMENYNFNSITIMNEEDIVKEVVNFIEAYLNSFKKLDSSLLKEYISVLYDVSNRVKSNECVMQFIDEFFLTLLNKLLDSFKTLEWFNIDIDNENISLCVMGCIITQFTFYVYDESYTYEHMITKIQRLVSLILHGNILKC